MRSHWHNDSGRPLSSFSWLEAHHRAKLTERTAFAKAILERRPRRIVDLGCGPGLWLELFHEHAPPDCEFVGLDADSESIAAALRRSRSWSRKVEFRRTDLESHGPDLPEADVFLAFNIFPYIKSPANFLEQIRERTRQEGSLVVRQYDGGLLRFGPLHSTDRQLIDVSLQTSLIGSTQFRHYSLDQTAQVLAASRFARKELGFELFQRTSPFAAEFRDYLANTVQWTMTHISDEASQKLAAWYNRVSREEKTDPHYFLEVDLVAWLS